MTNKKDDDKHASPRYWLDILVREFQGESDRACVILSATLLDTALEALLRARLVPNATSTDSLLDGSNAPLASFSARIDMAYRLGLISAQFARDLHIIRRIRNDFAHNISGCTFEDTSVRDRVMALSQSSGTTNCHDSWVRRIIRDRPRISLNLIPEIEDRGTIGVRSQFPRI
ncbi:MAG: MltR family transcriptional regulator [Sulfuricaulis sp.]